MASIKTLSSDTEIVDGKAIITEQVQSEMTLADVDRQINSIDMQRQQILQQVMTMKAQYEKLGANKTKYEEIKRQLQPEGERDVFSI